MDLPDGLTARPLRYDDAAAVTALMAAQEEHDLGEVLIEEADIVAEWQRPSFDVAASTVGVLDGERLVAYAEHSGSDRGDAAVHPDHRGRGIGTALASWMQATARVAGSEVVGMPVAQGSAGDDLLASLGYHVRWTSWVLTLPEGAGIVAQPVPDGHAVRAAQPAEHRRVWEVVEDAFLEWSDRDRMPYADFTAQVLQRPGFEPWNIRVVVDDRGDVVGTAVVHLDRRTGYVDRLAVRPDRRGRGLARALLVDAFGVARTHGATVSELSTDSRTGALGLYERVGMRTTSTWVNRAVDLAEPAEADA